MTHDLPGRRKRRYVHFVAQRTPDPLAACFRRARRQSKRYAEWVKPVIHSYQKIALWWSHSPDSKIGTEMAVYEQTPVKLVLY
jgi:hypothetical protein